MSLSEKVFTEFMGIIGNWIFPSMWAVVLMFVVWDFYVRFHRTNRDTDNVDLMYRYNWLRLTRRYKDV